MSFDPKQPYNDLPLLPPSGDLETKPVLKRCIAVNKIKGAGDLIPNQAMLINATPHTLHAAAEAAERRVERGGIHRQSACEI